MTSGSGVYQRKVWIDCGSPKVEGRGSEVWSAPAASCAYYLLACKTRAILPVPGGFAATGPDPLDLCFKNPSIGLNRYSGRSIRSTEELDTSKTQPCIRMARECELFHRSTGFVHSKLSKAAEIFQGLENCTCPSTAKISRLTLTPWSLAASGIIIQDTISPLVQFLFTSPAADAVVHYASYST